MRKNKYYRYKSRAGANNVKIGADQLEKAIKDTLNNYDREVLDAIQTSAKDHMDQLVEETKKTAPVRRGNLKRSIASKQVFKNAVGAEYVWYVKAPYYKETHLVENGRAMCRGGRTKAYHFVKNASDPIIEDYVKDVEEALKGD